VAHRLLDGSQVGLRTSLAEHDADQAMPGERDGAPGPRGETCRYAGIITPPVGSANRMLAGFDTTCYFPEHPLPGTPQAAAHLD